MTLVEDMLRDPFYMEIVGKCKRCTRDTSRGESHDCSKCAEMYCMNCVIYDVKGVTATILCPKKHFIAHGCNYEEDEELMKLT